MRGFALIVPALLLTAAAVMLAPAADAVATCDAAREAALGKECPDLVCYGYSGGRWQHCVPRDWIPVVPVPCRDHPCHEPLERLVLP